jgi:hypothetical protein
MYGKLFAQMYDGTLGTEGPWEALVTFQQMIVLADQAGVVDMTPEVLSRRTTIPVEIIRKGIAALEQPDPGSRSADEEGRRIVRLSATRDWGWRLVNYQKYREIRTAEERRAYQRAYWHTRKAARRRHSTETQHHSTPLNDSTETQRTQPIAEAEAFDCVSSLRSETQLSSPAANDPRRTPLCPHREIIAIYHEVLPTLPAVKVWDGVRERNLQARWRERWAEGKYASVEEGLAYWRRFFAHVGRSSFLMGKIQGGERSPFRASLDWLVKPSNFAKVIEHRYDDERGGR